MTCCICKTPVLHGMITKEKKVICKKCQESKKEYTEPWSIESLRELECEEEV